MRKTDEKGIVTLVEAVIVFPVTFIVVFLILMMGNVYYQNAAVERGVVETAIYAAAYSENPMMANIKKDGSVPTDPSVPDVKPYRYILSSNIHSICAERRNNLENYINGLSKLAFFKGIKPNVNKCTVRPSVNLIFSEVEVYCDYSIQLPLRMIFSKEPFRFEYEIKITEQIGDSTEFVRNASLVQDYLLRFKAVSNIAEKIGEKLNEIKKFIS